jgi:hypothetical protein
MINVDPDTVFFIAEKAREFHVKEDVVLPDEPNSPSDDWAMQVLADHAQDLTYQELKATIEDLEPDQQAGLVAIMWLGRGDYDAEEFASALKDAAGSWTERTADYLIATPLLPDYLEEGMAALGYEA